MGISRLLVMKIYSWTSGACAVLLLSIFLFSHTVYSSDNDLHDRLNVFEELRELAWNESNRVALEPYLESYRDLMVAIDMVGGYSDITDDDVRSIFKALVDIVFYTSSPIVIDDIEHVFSELQKREILLPRDYFDLYNSMLRSRSFPEAVKFRKKYPTVGLKAPPDFEISGEILGETPTRLIVSDHERKVTREAYSVNKGFQLVSVVSLRCTFSRHAMETIAEDPAIINALHGQAIWLVPEGMEGELEEIQGWNRNHAGMRLDLSYRWSEWPMIEDVATPVFYFLQDGKLVEKLTGWPDDSRLEDLRTVLDHLGVSERTEP
jgi:hypothetical protein